MGNGDEFDDMFEEKEEDFSVEVDFGDVKAFEALAPGGYRAVVTDVKKGMSKSSNQPKLSWVFELLEPYAGRKMFAETSLQPQALWKLKGWLEMLGIETEGKLKLDRSTLVGRKCILLLIVDTYQGTKRNKVDGLLPFSQEGEAKPPVSSKDEIVDDVEF